MEPSQEQGASKNHPQIEMEKYQVDRWPNHHMVRYLSQVNMAKERGSSLEVAKIKAKIAIQRLLKSNRLTELG